MHEALRLVVVSAAGVDVSGTSCDADGVAAESSGALPCFFFSAAKTSKMLVENSWLQTLSRTAGSLTWIK